MAKLKREKSGLKILAADAKARLKNGFHNKSDFDDKLHSNDYYIMVKRSLKCKQKTNKEEQFYRKVQEILSDGAVTNPIQKLVDKEALLDLSYPARQRYLLEISQKFNKVKNEIENLASAKY